MATSFGIMTPPVQVAYEDLVRVWKEADEVPEIGHAWLFDHLMPIGGDPGGPAFEGWSLLSALAAQTTRIGVGLLVTSNRFRPPAMLAKIAATVDVVAGGRMEFGLGVGSRPNPPSARREYPAHGLPFQEPRDAVKALDEACTVIRRLWTEPEPFDFHGEYVDLTGAFCNPRPATPKPFLLAGRAASTLRVVARHADIWNIAGGDLDDCVDRSRLLDRFCGEIGRDPHEITRSMALAADPQNPAGTREAVKRAIGAGFGHIVLILPAPYTDQVAHRVRDGIIAQIGG
ncbi:LLM class flavin-dependent oxidoreductase [Kineosporia mesophila]|nr:LLM class flavin-dependent oxidoreductase [Kineosporia mesophila]MCD5354109.1 LLM class flavin-dependent oxidoreductase [Kineosporia mesophila]